jgi:hypothetical protein
MRLHLTDGCALRKTAVKAAEGCFVSVSDVAILKRLRNCGALIWPGLGIKNTICGARERG